MVIVAATTSFRFEGKNVSAGKSKASGDVLRAITDMVKAVALAFGGPASPTG